MPLNYINSKILISLSLYILGFYATASRAFQFTGKLWYIAPILFLLVIILNAKIFLSKEYLLEIILINIFGIWSLFTSFWSLYPLVTIQRALYFILIINTSFITSKILMKFSLSLYSILFPILLFSVLISVFSLLINYPENSWTGGNSYGFMGFTIHQNTLGSLILFTIPSILLFHFKATSDKKSIVKKTSNISKLFFWFLFLTAITILLFTHSRASILSLTLFFLLLSLFLHFRVALVSLFVFLIICIGTFILFPKAAQYIKSYLTKNSQSLFDSRIYLWKTSYQSAFGGGWAGIGYGISHPYFKNNFGNNRSENGRFIREKGNSFLALIEETGIIGFILFLVPIIFIFKKSIKVYSQQFNIYSLHNNRSIKHYNNKFTSRFSLLTFKNFRLPFHLSRLTYKVSSVSPSTFHCSLFTLHLFFLISIIVHSQFEAWMTSVASFQVLIYYLLISSLIVSKEKI